MGGMELAILKPFSTSKNWFKFLEVCVNFAVVVLEGSIRLIYLNLIPHTSAFKPSGLDER